MQFGKSAIVANSYEVQVKAVKICKKYNLSKMSDIPEYTMKH
jgi:hypothetical protein